MKNKEEAAPAAISHEKASIPMSHHQGDDDGENYGKLIALSRLVSDVVLHKKPNMSKRPSGILIGRNLECDVVINEAQISNRHCLVFFKKMFDEEKGRSEDCCFLEDTSSNGTYVNGTKIGKSNVVKLQDGDTIQLFKLAQGGPEGKFFKYEAPPPPASAVSVRNANTIADAYTFDKELGSGNFASVRLATDNETGDHVAIKVIDKRRFHLKPKFVTNLKDEISIMFGVKHDNIVSIIDVYEDAEQVYIVLELVPGGEMFDRITQLTKFTEEQTRQVMIQMLSAIKYLHERGIVHRDLKPENVLMVSKDLGDMTVKISDFGLARLVIGDETVMQTLCGTPNYAAPEVLAKGERAYTEAIDLWSLGVVLYICLCGYPPFSDDLAPPSMIEQIRRGKFAFQNPWWRGISHDAKDMICKLLKVDPNERLTAGQALQHPWMKINAAEFSSQPIPKSLPVSMPVSVFTRGDTLLSPSKLDRTIIRVKTPELDTNGLQRKRPGKRKNATTNSAEMARQTAAMEESEEEVDRKRQKRETTPPLMSDGSPRKAKQKKKANKAVK
ncbi:hypothetical protein SmJEL517_g02916 [Synchytrium microbalum]|uniref:Uncharacterized protein n=1 Tax=Synchytrium microbalum TaxID=1806994 RepID=A0A507C063_9FUNG|nr:uncharacterized protein SmJEL517_g02916 [Synchytrium microbalum]TPX34457.1 hypothetical protein SmJEL517_g02916 [Synchytrium microbalum]